MSQYRLSEVAKLLGVSTDTVRRWAQNGLLNLNQDNKHRQVVDGTELARFVKEKANQPHDFPSSARNRLCGLVTEVKSDLIMSQVEIQCGPFRVVSLMSTESVKTLDLKVGDTATAVIKSTNVIVEKESPC